MEADRVTVVLEAQTRQYLADLNKADADFKRVAGNVEREALSMGTSAQVGANAAASAFARAGNAANSMNVGNIAAQFQDIGVTAAMGMNPMIIALQQGTQLSAVLNQSVAAGVSPARMLGQAFAQIINPISLATIATVALGTAAVQYFTTLIRDGQVSEEVLKRQETAIRAIADRWGEAVPALQAVVAEMDRLEGVQQETDAYDLARSMNLEEARAQIEDLNNWVFELAGELEAAGASRSQVEQLTSAFADMRDGVRDGTVTVEELNAVTAALAVLQMTQGIPALERFTESFGSFAAIVREAAGAVAQLNAEQAALDATAIANDALGDYIIQQSELNGMNADQLAHYNEMARVRAELGRLGAEEVATEEQISQIASDRLAAEARRRKELQDSRASGRAGTKMASEAEREAQAVLDLIAALEHELSIVGLANEQKAVANALRQAGSAATDEQRAQIESLVLAIEGERAAIAQADEQMQQLRDSARSAMETIINGFIEGKDAGDIFSAVLSDIASQLINMGLNSIFGSGNDFGLFGQMFNIPGRQYGGDVRKGQPYIVGEKRPELFIPDQNGTIVPSVPTVPSIGGGGATSVTFAPVIDARGADVAAVARLEQVVARQQAEFNVRVQAIIKGRGKKWID